VTSVSPNPTIVREATPALAATGVTVRFGGLVALSDVAIDVPTGTIVGLVGPNGAGKSTLFGVISGVLRPASGQVFMAGKDVTATSSQNRARLGLARTFQHPELFMGLSVRDHLVLGHRVRYERRRFWSDLVNLRAIFPPTKFETEQVDSLLELLGISHLAKTQVSVLPLGLARLVEVGRALATHPSVVLLDEPLSGLDLHATENLTAVFERVVANSDDGLSLVMVEHDVASVLALSSKIFVLDFGQLIAQGTPDEIRAHPAVRAAYLGDEEITAKGGGAPRTAVGPAPPIDGAPPEGPEPA
jgi:ABC-type branched-subunit amino acid transport system ATPase component